MGILDKNRGALHDVVEKAKRLGFGQVEEKVAGGEHLPREEKEEQEGEHKAGEENEILKKINTKQHQPRFPRMTHKRSFRAFFRPTISHSKFIELKMLQISCGRFSSTASIKTTERFAMSLSN